MFGGNCIHAMIVTMIVYNSIHAIIELDDGKISRKALYLMFFFFSMVFRLRFSQQDQSSATMIAGTAGTRALP